MQPLYIYYNTSNLLYLIIKSITIYRNYAKLFFLINNKDIKELFTKENEGKTVYLGVCGVHEDGTIYPSVYCRLGAIRL